MSDDDHPDPPDQARVYRNYLVTCQRVVVEPLPYERARELVAEWTKVIADSAVPPVKR